MICASIHQLEAQTATDLSINDTRAVNDLPNFSTRNIRADFKERHVIGVPGDGIYSTNVTLSPWANNENSGGKNHQLNFNNGGVFYRNALPMDAQWGTWQQFVLINENGNVGIGITNPQNKLDVNGAIHSKEVKVDMTGWSDFVFKKEYKLPTLEEVQKHINEKGHLENIPNEAEVLKNGINLGEMNAKLLQKIEELTLYMIEQNQRIERIEKENNKLKMSQNQMQRELTNLNNSKQ